MQQVTQKENWGAVVDSQKKSALCMVMVKISNVTLRTILEGPAGIHPNDVFVSVHGVATRGISFPVLVSPSPRRYSRAEKDAQ